METDRRYVKLLRLFLIFGLLFSSNTFFAQGVVQTVSTFQSVSIFWTGSGGSSSIVCNVKYRQAGASAWTDGYPLWFDTRTHNANDIPGYQGVVLPGNQYRGSIVGLNAGTNYEIQLTAGANTITANATTWAETSSWPVDIVTPVTNSSAQLNITTSGTAAGYRLYTGSGTIDVANAAPNCIYINAAYIIIRGLTLKGASEDAIRLGPQAHDVVIENCDISGWGATTYASAYSSFPNTHSGVRIRGKAENDAGSTENCYAVTRIVVQRNKIHDPRGTAGSWDNGYPYGPQGVCFQEAGGNNVIRYNDIYGSDTKHFQDAIGGLNNFTKSGFPRENTDIYGNKISYCWDDGIEVEGADCNVRIYGNFLDNTFTGISTATNSIGPLYVYRNVTYVGRRHGAGASNSSLDVEDRGPFNKCGTQNNGAIGGRTFLFHNTVLQPTQPGFANTRGLNGGIMDNGGGPVQNNFSRNNIWTAAYQGQGGRAVAEYYNGSGVGCSYQYDVCNTPLILLAGVAGNILNGNPTYAAGVPVAPLAINAGPRAQGYELSTNSIGYNAGTVLPNFNDGYAGAAPDAGAYEAGRPLLQFGVSAYLPSNNIAPVANAGNDTTITLPASSVTLTGIGTDADGTIASYSWVKAGSTPPGGTLTTPNAATTGVTGLNAAGIYVFVLTVTDNQGATGTDTVRVTVLAASNIPPTANAGSDITITLPTTTANLIGSGADADGAVASYSWTKVGATPSGGVLATPNASNTAVSGLSTVGTYVFKLTVTDNLGATGTDTVRVIVLAAPNLPPTANAGSDITITLPATTTNLIGSGADADGTIASYSWVKVGTTPAGGTLSTPNASSSAVSGLATVGTYVFKLTVTDNQGATGMDTVRVVVLAAPNLPPTANAGSDITITLPATTTNLIGSGTDADGSIASYSWVKVGTTPAGGTLTSPNASTTGVSGLSNVGTYMFRLTVTDNLGSTGTDTVRVTVLAAPNQPPVANAGNNITLNQPASSTGLDGTASFDPNGTIAGYTWTFINGPVTPLIVNSNAATSTVNGMTAVGTYVFQLRVTDNNGATDDDNVTIVISTTANIPPIADAGNNITLTLPLNSTNLNGGSSSDPDGIITSFAWSLVSGTGPYSITNAGSAATALSGLAAGTYVFRLTVTDDDGAISSDDITVTVNAAVNQPPVANAGSDITITLPINSTTLTGSGYDPDGTIASYAWSWVSGNGTFTIVDANIAVTALNNLAQGVYVFRLTVRDNTGAEVTDNVTVTVLAATPPANQAPTANAGSDITLTLPTNSTTLTGTGYDPDGTIASYTWAWVSGQTIYSINNPSAATTALNGLVQGVYVFRLTVTDNSGATATDLVTITVNQSTNLMPTANAGADISITLPTNTTTLYGSGNDPDGTITNYSWSYVNGPSGSGYTIANTNAATTGLYNLSQGVYTFRLTVTDNRGGTASDNITVTVNAAAPATNLPPIARTGNDITITLPTNSTELHGNTSSDPDGVITSYKWTQISGPAQSTIINSTSSIATATNLTTGIYTFELKVTDDDGASSTKTMKVTVNNPTTPKVIITVYPNPTTGILNVQYVSNVNGKLRVRIYDANKKLLSERQVDKNQVSITFSLDVSSYKKGVYFLEVTAANGKKTTVTFSKM